MIRLFNDSFDELNIDVFSFPDGTQHVKILDTIVEKFYVIEAQIEDGNTIFQILLLKDALDRKATKEMGQVPNVELVLSYMLGSRQDRVMIKGEPLSAKIYADVINSANFTSISVVDPHSPVTISTLNNASPWMPMDFYLAVKPYSANRDMVVVSPDTGALGRARAFATLHNATLLKADKSRELSTGKIISFDLYASKEDIEGKVVVLVDDIVTNGGTFLGLLNKIKEYNPAEVILVVTHADHEGGLKRMADEFDSVWVTNSRKDYSFDAKSNIHVYQLF